PWQKRARPCQDDLRDDVSFKRSPYLSKLIALVSLGLLSEYVSRHDYLLGIFGKLRGTIPAPSFTATIWLIGTLASLSTVPLGHVTSSDSIVLRCPSPK